MIVISDVDEMRARSLGLRHSSGDLALVPTMGALHDGHMSLVRIARQLAPTVVVSVFVNPSQFGPREDYGRYPRNLAADIERLEEAGGVDIVFAPGVENMYPGGVDDHVVRVVPGSLTDHLCGPFRPGHFEGVATVVTKLFNACMPTVAVFGRKDAQQFVIVRRLSRELNFGIDIVGGPTIREPDGLALSSRNAYLNGEERRQATVLHEAIEAARERVSGGELESEAVVDSMIARVSKSPLAELQYAEIVDSGTLQPVRRLKPGGEVIAAVAASFGETRLIDNVFVRVPGLDPLGQEAKGSR